MVRMEVVLGQIHCPCLKWQQDGGKHNQTFENHSQSFRNFRIISGPQWTCSDDEMPPAIRRDQTRNRKPLAMKFFSKYTGSLSAFRLACGKGMGTITMWSMCCITNDAAKQIEVNRSGSGDQDLRNGARL
jgi:hypothetical protein